MGTPLSCASRDVLRRAVPDGTASALRLGPDERACAVLTTWKAARETAAVAATYLPVLFAVSYFFIEFGPNMTTFVCPSEIFPTPVRGLADGISAGGGKIGAFLGALLVPTW